MVQRLSSLILTAAAALMLTMTAPVLQVPAVHAASAELNALQQKVVPLDYSKVENWLINDNADTSRPYDLIFFVGTAVLQPTQATGIAAMDEASRVLGLSNFMMCGSELAENARVFCPMQRQVALSYALKYTSHEAILADIANKEPYADLKAALDYYFEHYNKDGKRPFVLAGHSQGGASVQVVLEKYFLTTDKKDYLHNMIAAYSIGYGVASKDFAAWPNKEGRLHFATGRDDFNCLISWNTEGVGEKGTSFLLADKGDTTLVINPINWKRDTTYAGISENDGVLVKTVGTSDPGHLSLLPQDLMDAQVDVQRGSVICSTSKDFIKLPVKTTGELWGGKSLHGYDGKGYFNNIKNNLRVRVNHFLAAKSEK